MPNIQWFLSTRNSTMGFVVQFAEPPFIRMVEFHCVKIYHDKSLPLVQIFTLKISNISKIKAIKNNRDLNASLLELSAKASVLAGKSPAALP